MAFKMKGTAMYDKMMVDGKSMMKLKKEFGGAMEMKSPMDMGHSPKKMKSPMDKALKGDQDKLPPELQKEILDSPEKMKTPMDLSPNKLTQDAAMKLTSEIKKSGMPLKEEDDSPMEIGMMGIARSVMGNKPMEGFGSIVSKRNMRGRRNR